MNRVMLNNLEVMIHEDSFIKMGVTTALNNTNFKFDTEEGKGNLKLLKESLGINKISYLKQIHSDKIIIADDSTELSGLIEGDALITSCGDTLIGVFTADCVPVLIYDINKKVIAAVHSGWKGTYNSIVMKTVETMINDFQCTVESIKVFIGPHIKQCCYEVSKELIDKFKAEKLYSDKNINSGRYLSLEKCIEAQLINIGVDKTNILKSNLCTLCEKKVKLHSYRKDGEHSGRMFTYIYFK
ncbi:peptidoglycan editing factor PgeF [Clostridium sp. C8-1-8]|uniref:peptidoglycan editing factor PgeF n=1 Tax=Clostridium sp. C8-1-8 TaxID=2698831 RepID=UPI001369E976|nr:peptidoglycan editing factor PgeF [Clostridium sp. C8-1-8]